MLQGREFDKLRSIVYRETGIAISEDKRELLTNRVGKRLRALGLRSAGEYLHILETDAASDELLEFIDAVSTNVTHFFREGDHFDLLKKYIAAFEKNAEIKIWCSACATGEEPYTLAMVALSALERARCRCRILATDICGRALRAASQGCYSEHQVKKVPRDLLGRYFTKERRGGEVWYSAGDDLRKTISFRRMNLSKFPYPLSGPIDVIFCRNVMIYFDVDLRAKMVGEFQRLLRPGGSLFIGHSENLLGISHQLKSVQASVFTR